MGQDWKDYNDTVVKDWRRKPRFAVLTLRDKDKIELKVVPIGEHRMLWVWVDQGTDPYVIRPRFAPALKFQTDYRPRTMPRANYRVGPGRSIGPWVTAQEVNHPGIEARNFTLEQADEVSQYLVNDLVRYLNRR